MPHDRQENALLMLPDMHHLVNEEPLVIEIARREIRAIPRALRGKVDRSGWRHHRIARLEERPFAQHDAAPRIVDRVAEHRPGKRDLPVGQWAVHGGRGYGAGSPAAITVAAYWMRRPSAKVKTSGIVRPG